MELKPGYKLTEAAVIPEDWEASPLPNNIWFQEGPGLRNWQFRSSGLKVINVTNLQEDGYLDLSATERHISWEEFERTYRHFLIDDGDVVMASSGNSYCKTAVIRRHDLPLLMNTSVIRFKARGKIDKSFMLIYLKSRHFKDQIDLMITGGAQPNFGPFHLRTVVIPLPPTLAEQRAIAEALSDVDALIESLAQLIAKKRAVKQGAMQALLTGKTRLPGFEGEWEVRCLGEVSELKSGYAFKSNTYNEYGSWRLVTIANVQDGYMDLNNCSRIPTLPLDIKPHQVLEMRDILVSMTGNVGRVCRVLETDCVLNQRVGKVIPKHIDRDFLFELLRQRKFQVSMDVKTKGGAQGNLSVIDIMEYQCNIPNEPAEQTAIAAVLSDMDAEIEALEAKLTKACQVKLGMMQELLTGRVRLV